MKDQETSRRQINRKKDRQRVRECTNKVRETLKYKEAS